MTDTYKSVRVRIEGRVQGVGFRAWVERRPPGTTLTAGCATAGTAASKPCSQAPLPL
jgi:hypothetical protein